MSEFDHMYTTLFNAITDAIRELDRLNFGAAKEVLIQAQQQTEDIYISHSED